MRVGSRKVCADCNDDLSGVEHTLYAGSGRRYCNPCEAKRAQK